MNKTALANLGNAIENLRVSINTKKPNSIVIDAILHRFKVTINLFFKVLRKLLMQENFIETHEPKILLKDKFF